MAFACERTVWAEGMGLADDCVEALTLVAERARCSGFRGELPPGNIGEWPLRLEEEDFPDLAQDAREIMNDYPECFS